MFNDGKDHVTFASDMAVELVEKELVKQTVEYDPETKTTKGEYTYKPGNIMTSGGHC